MAFDCAYRSIPVRDAERLTADAIAAHARAHGLGRVYVVAALETLPHRWRRTVDVVVHMADGDDILGAQFPDEAHAAVTAAMEELLHARCEVSETSVPRSAALLPPPDRTARV